MGHEILIPLKESRRTPAAWKPLEAVLVKELTAADLDLPAEGKLKPPPIARIGERHHTLAKLIACGKTQLEAGAMLNLTPQRVCAIVNDPAFAVVLQTHLDNQNEIMQSLVEKASGLSKDVIDELHNRFEDDAESFTNAQLLDIFKHTADKVIPKGGAATEVNVTVGLDAAVAQAEERLKRVKDGGPVVLEGETA